MADAPVEVGEVLAGKYRIERVLGHGGMGVVAAARHAQLDELVAIKFLLPKALEHKSLVARFNQEARAQIKVKSEHVARTIDVGTLENGAPYMVLEYLEGADLASLLKREGRFSITRAVDLMLQACEALAEAHALGIVHRDLKPANLFVTRRADDSECVKVLDFGISKFTDGSAGDSLDLTRTNMVLGSPLYMSPEQLRSAKLVDGRADVWSLGIIMFELLSNSLPFYEDTIAQLCVSVMVKPLPNIQQLVPEIPDALREAVEKATAKEPDERYANVAEFAAGFAPFGTEEAMRSLRRAERITQDALSRSRSETQPDSMIAAGGNLAETSVDGRSDPERLDEMQKQLEAIAKKADEEAALGDSELSDSALGESDTVHSGQLHSLPGGDAATVAAQTTVAVKSSERAASGVQQHTLDGVASQYGNPNAQRRWLVPLVALGAMTVGALLVWGLVGSDALEGGKSAASTAAKGDQSRPSNSSSDEPSQAEDRKQAESSLVQAADAQRDETQKNEAAGAAGGAEAGLGDSEERDEDADAENAAAETPVSEAQPTAEPPSEERHDIQVPAQQPTPVVKRPPQHAPKQPTQKPEPPAPADPKPQPVIVKPQPKPVGNVYGERE